MSIFTRALMAWAAASALLLLAGCGGGRDDEEASAGVEAESSGRSGGGGDASAGPASGGGGNPLLAEEPAEREASGVEVANDTAAEAMRSFMDLLIAGEYRRAAEAVATPGAEGTALLLAHAERMDQVRADAGDATADLAISLVGQEYAAATWSPVAEEADRVVFLLNKENPNAQDVEIEVVRIDGVWYVTPPATTNGMP